MGHHKVDPKTYVQIGLKGLLDQIAGASARSSGRTISRPPTQVLPMPGWDKR